MLVNPKRAGVLGSFLFSRSRAPPSPGPAAAAPDLSHGMIFSPSLCVHLRFAQCVAPEVIALTNGTYSACEAPLLRASCDQNLFWFAFGEFFSATFGFLHCFTESLLSFSLLLGTTFYFFEVFSIDVEWGMSATARCLGFGG